MALDAWFLICKLPIVDFQLLRCRQLALGN